MNNRPGFTIAELLVTMAVCTVLVVLLFPAVQAARQAARRTSSINNAKNIVLGLQQHRDTEPSKKLPGGASDSANPSENWSLALCQTLLTAQFDGLDLKSSSKSEHNLRLFATGRPAIFWSPEATEDAEVSVNAVGREGAAFNLRPTSYAMNAFCCSRTEGQVPCTTATPLIVDLAECGAYPFAPTFNLVQPTPTSPKIFAFVDGHVEVRTDLVGSIFDPDQSNLSVATGD